jgi:hypothetical protein
VQAWVWILWIVISPLLQNINDQMYLYINVRDLCAMTARFLY